MKRTIVTISALFLSIILSFGYDREVKGKDRGWQENDRVVLDNGRFRLEWSDRDGYVLDYLSFDGVALPIAKHQRTVLYSPDKPDETPLPVYGNDAKESVFPEPKYKYIVEPWKQNNTPVALNKAGSSIAYRPSEVLVTDDGRVIFSYEDENMAVRESWSPDEKFSGDIKVSLRLVAGKEGWYSLSSPSLSSSDKENFIWATVPGIYQGNKLNSDFIRALAYSHGIPDRPVVSRERTATTLTSIISDKAGVTLAVTAEPGTGRDPWEADRKTISKWQLGLSLMNREGEFTPTLYHPVLGESGSFLHAGDTLSFDFTYSFSKEGWYEVLKHAALDIYRFKDAAALRTTSLSLSERLEMIHSYLVNDSTSMWRNCSYKGVTIGAQDYRGGVYGADKDAMKNADYGAMWMLASMTGDPRLSENRLPAALNFKLCQQNSEPGFFMGSSAGQYYLYKSSKFTEEWGPYTEPIATSYYMLMDLGNIILFEPHREDLKASLRLAADCLLRWMKPDGSWEVAYDNDDSRPAFGDLKDYRPTFYGLYVAWKILGDDKYLEAAEKAATWYIDNAVAKGRFLGVCGDTRFAPDFATAQSVQALLDLFEVTGAQKYRDAAFEAARIYSASVYTHPIPSRAVKTVKGVKREDWEISQAGLGFEHGGIIGSANHRGPILLSSHAGMFVRLARMTGDEYFLDLARASATGRDAFVDKKTGVASYYWDSMNNGAGPYPHHAWWQLGWITDYLVSEAWYRSEGKISFPGSFITPKVGPHRSYGFRPGEIDGRPVSLLMRQGLVKVSCHDIEYLTAMTTDGSCLYVILMNSDDESKDGFKLTVDTSVLKSGKTSMKSDKTSLKEYKTSIEAYGLKIIKINLGGFSEPLPVSENSPVMASIDNGNLRLNFVKAEDRFIAIRTEVMTEGGWRRFKSEIEDSKTYLLAASDSPLHNKNFYPAWPESGEEDILNPYNSGMLSEAIPVNAVRTGEMEVTVHYITKDGSRMEGIWTLPQRGNHIEVEMRCKAASDGMYSIVFSSFQALAPEQVTNVLMPPMFQFRRLPEEPLMMLSSMMQQPLAVVETDNPDGSRMAEFVCVAPESFAGRWGGVDFSPVGFALHAPSGKIQPVAFSPVMGMPDSKLSKGSVLSRKFVLGAIGGGWNDALEYVSSNVFKVRDYRQQDEVSLTETYFNILDLMKNDEYGGWNQRMKGFYDIEGDPGTAPTVVHCSPLAVLSASVIGRDEDLYVSRALPTIEYILSRSGYRWAEDIVPTGYNKTYKTLELNPFTSQFNTSCYEGAGQLLSGLNPWLEAVALPGGEIRKSKGYSTPVLPWVQYISAYKMTGDGKWLDKAVSTADRFIATNLYKPSTKPIGKMAFYNSIAYPQWWNLIDLYELTKDEKYLKAASYGAASTLAGVRTYPMVDDGTITIHPKGRYNGNTTMWWKGREKFRLGFPRVAGDVQEKVVSQALVSPVGLGFEQPGTYFLRAKGKLTRPVFLNSWAPHLLRLYGYTGKEIYNVYARNAVIGRFANYPGYYATGFTDVTMSEDFPYKGPDVSSIYYHHIPPHLALTLDYLVSEMIQRSAGSVEFPYSIQEGFVWFANRIYGGGRGRIYNDKNVRLFMRKGMVCTDNPKVNYVTAVSDRNFWILLANESAGDETVTLTLDLPEQVRPTGKPAAVHGKDRKAAKASLRDGKLRVEVPAKGFSALSLPAEIEAPEQLPVLNHGYTEVDSETSFGKIRIFRIRSPFGWDSIFGFAETAPQKDKSMSMSVRCNDKEYEVSAYPFEWTSIRLRPDEDAVIRIRLEEDGRVKELPEIVMKSE